MENNKITQQQQEFEIEENGDYFKKIGYDVYGIIGTSG